MKLIKDKESNLYVNGKKCSNNEYLFDDEELGISRSVINGIYPEDAYCSNEKCKELVYVMSGSGKIIKDNGSIIFFEKDDSILIERGEKYYWDAKCVLLSITTPKWFETQHIITKR